jgi:hypothetical protein
MRFRFWTAFAVGVVSFSCAASAQVSWNGYNWNVDRYDTEKFDPIGSHLGRADVLNILLGDSGFDTNAPRFGTGFQNGFYNTQGRKALVNLPGSAFVTGDLYLPGSWAAQQAAGWKAAGLWGESAKAPNPNDIVGYHIISFSNSANVNGFQGAAVPGMGGRFAVFDDDTGVWNVVNATINYDAWNTVRFEVHPDHVDFFVNGTLVHTDNVVDIDPQNYLKSIFLNSVTNNTTEYDVFWANVFAGLLLQQNPSVFDVTAAVPDMTKYYIYSSIGDLASRRGAEATEHFSPYDYVWAYAGGTTGQFDLSNSSGYDATTYFLRSGIDIIQPMESLRLGLTVSAGRAEVDADSGGSADSDNYSGGGYLTYATRELYVDVIAEYAWSEWNVAVPNNGSDKSNVDTYVASGEVGTSLWMAKGVRVVPNASLLYLNTDYKDMSFNIANVSFAGDEALIGRAGARVEYMFSPNFGGSRIYAGVSAVKDLMDEEGIATVQSIALPGGRDVSFAGGFGSQTSAQFNGGIDLKIAKGTRLYGDTSYITGGDVDAFRGSGGFIVNW